MGGYSSNYGTTGTTGTTTTGGYTPNYGATGGNNLGSYAPPAYNTRSARTDMGDTMDTRAEPELTGQGAFGGTAASGSSYNAPESGARKTSGPHSSDLLNKLDPRVHSSDYESSTAGNQRGY